MQSQTQTQKIRILRLFSNVVWKEENGRLRVVLWKKGDVRREAFLDPRRIRAVYVVEVVDEREGYVAGYDYYVEYESSHEFYEQFDVKRLPRVGERKVISEFRIEVVSKIEKKKPEEALRINPWWLRKVGRNRFKVYLKELEKWDEYAWNFATAVEIYETNIHPYYGVMD